MPVGGSAHRSLAAGIAAVLAIVLVLLAAYQPLWAAVSDPAQYPWGSDTLGHLYRYEFIRQAVSTTGSFYPQVMPAWYMGMQLLRYYPPLPYYFLFFLDVFSRNSLLALQLFIPLWMLVGGLSWLLFRRWLGWIFSALGGCIFLLLPDLVRVAFSEGNLPRVMATALAPLLVYLALRALEEDRALRHLSAAALVFAVITLCHAMMAAIFAVSLSLFSILAALSGVSKIRRAARLVAAMASGIVLSGWWLLPSLSGGITELNPTAVNLSQEVSGWQALLNPAQRLSNPETLYVGLSLMLLPLFGLAFPWARSRMMGLLAGCGLFGVALAAPVVNQLFTTLPISFLLWPGRWLGIASIFFLLAFLWGISRTWRRLPWLVPVLVVLVAADCWISTRLIFVRPANPALLSASAQMAASPGWREATLDDSRLGSSASYFFSQAGGREQVFGWGYQGARTAKNVAGLNDALQYGALAYVRDRIRLFGVDDIVSLKTLPNREALGKLLAEDGFSKMVERAEIAYYHRDGSPRGVIADWRTLAIGSGGVNYSYLFPQVVCGDSYFLDDYTLEDLAAYDRVILAGFNWRDREKAENLARQAAENGVLVYVDLTGVPQEPLSRLPRFLGVWGEAVILPHEALSLTGPSGTIRLQPFGTPADLWHTHIPQGAGQDLITFNYLGKSAVVEAASTYGSGKVNFVGINLAYHALTENDPDAVALLGNILGLEPGKTNPYRAVALSSYSTLGDRYQFQYRLEQAADLLIPIARHDGTRVFVDGIEVESRSLENLIVIHSTAGAHQVVIGYQPTPIYTAGLAASTAALLGWAAVLVAANRKPARQEAKHAER